MTLAAFLAAWALHLVAAASPGPAVLMAARTGVTEGFRTGVWLALGLGLGAVVWAVAALFGLAVLFKVAPALLLGFKIAGGLFLCWIGFQMWRHAAGPLAAPGAGRVARHGWALPRSCPTRTRRCSSARFSSAPSRPEPHGPGWWRF